ncbi:receptor-like protein EIX1 [Quercus robur]|uniref:receptor-like protein EIX1 n=1 Tax=Quercus robur TaxID=38942 RepID=UPI00216193BC|nr:receptor-like protein EIX1 [Quercus robur]
MASMKTTFLPALIFLVLQTEFISLEAIWSNSSAGNSTVGCIDMEREALLKFKEGLHDPSGTLSSWVGEDCCNWLGVGCSNRTGNIIKLDLKRTFFCDMYSDITECMKHSSLGGVLSPSLLELKFLNYLDLSSNYFEEISIPNFIGSLNKLTYLNLSDSWFGGTIPPQIGNLSNLLYLDLSPSQPENSLTVSNINWLSGLSSLKYLNLNNVDLSEATTDWLQTVNLLPSLLELHLHNCELHYLPQNFPSVNFTSLSVLDLSDNDFNSSSIPQWVFNFTSLTNLQLSSSNLAGSIPKIAKGNLCNLRNLDLSENFYLSGEITEFFQALSECSNSSLEELYLGINQLIGNIPHSLGNLKRLRELDLDSNAFSGSIPSSIQNLSRLEILYLEDNKMNGTIPESIGQLSELKELHLSGNSWQGNQLTGKIPENIGSLHQLETLDLSSNHLSGHIPPSMSSMTFLSHLNLSYNNLSGQIPSANQFLTFNDPSIYEGNPQLHGPPPLPTSFSMPSGNAEHKDQEDVHVHNNGEDQFENLWFYLSIALGFIVGFWVVCGSLLIKKSWRQTYFCFAEKMKDRLLVVIALNMAHLQRKIQAERH